MTSGFCIWKPIKKWVQFSNLWLGLYQLRVVMALPISIPIIQPIGIAIAFIQMGGDVSTPTKSTPMLAIAAPTDAPIKSL